mmetsp:Transcript_19251/g.32296  ORF Transcript_19251/g.32296 Transcript_19251/m.32296 type:complete len:437 (-) Transcript_19251:245-1555(-)
MSHLHVDLLFLLLLMAGSRANTIDYTERCNLPRSVLLPEEHKNPRFPLQFIEFSCSSEKGRYGKCSKLGGIGNFLVLFPAVYLYAMVSGRHLILHDNSAMGQWCRALNCTFPFTSEVENLYPALKKIKKVPSYNPNDIAYNIRLNNSFPDTIVGLHSMEIFSSGWIDYAGKHTPECVERITGCHRRLHGCMERFAFQQLLHGGFRHGAIPSAVVGMLPSEVHQVLTAPYLSIPRFDAGIHIRAQTRWLEYNQAKNHTQFALDMEGYRVVFRAFERALSHRFFSQTPVRFNVTNSSLTGSWPRIFVSCDDTDVRDAFVAWLKNRTADMGRILPVFVNASRIKHVKHISFDDATPQQGMVDTAFDWYALSLSEVVYAWRRGYTHIVSTFMQSATRVSMVKPTNKDFKATILRKDLKFVPDFEYVDDVNELPKKGKKKK